MNRLEMYKLRHEIEQEQKWQDETARLPWIQFPADWKVKVIPPYGDAVVRFLVTLPDGKEKSVYHDSRASLGMYFGDGDELIPYWEVYPVNGDVGRCGTDDVELLLEMIAEVSEEQEDTDANVWITDRKPTEADADCTGFVWITTECGLVLREQWKTVRDRPWMPITPPEPYVEPPKRYKLMYRSTTRQYYIQDTESCDKRFVASCIPTREKAARISNIFEEQNSMSKWITDRMPCAMDTDNTAFVYNQYGAVTHYTHIKEGEAWMMVPRPEPYVKPKRWRVTTATGGYLVYDSITSSEVADSIPTCEAAERIAAIYEEVVP